MRVSEVMTPQAHVVGPDTPIHEAARRMAEIDAGFLPVADNDRLVGMVTDRDIAVRGVGRHLGPDTRVVEVMTTDVKYCFEHEDLDHVARNMAALQVRRLPVVNKEKRLVGVLSLGDLATNGKPEAAATAMEGVAQPGGTHRQSLAGMS